MGQKILIFFSLLFATGYIHAYEFKHFELMETQHIRRGENSITDTNQSTSSPLNSLTQFLIENHQNIGNQEAQKVLKNHNTNQGFLNFSGFNWTTQFGTIHVNANREIAPKLHGNEWIVHDSFYLSIDASELIDNLEKSGILKITNNSRKLFAGLQFTRTYHYYHFAKSYKEGLVSDFSKLFLALQKFNTENFNLVDHNEVVKLKDQFSYNAGASLDIPISPYLNLNTEITSTRTYSSELMIQAVDQNEQSRENEKLRVSIDKEVNQNTSVTLDVQLDFFHLLKQTIFEYQLEYSYASANKLYLSLDTQNIQRIKQDELFKAEFEQVLKTDIDEIDLLKESIVQQEQRITENLNSRFSFLLIGKLQKRATEQVKIIKDGIEKVFYKHYSRSVKYVQSFLSRLFSDIILKVFSFPSIVQNKVEKSKELLIEYESIKDLTPSTVQDESQFSVQINFQVKAHKTHKWYHKAYKNTAVGFLKNFTAIDSQVISQVNNRKLIGPLSASAQFNIGIDGLKFFNQQSSNKIEKVIEKACRDIPLKKITKRRGRRRYIVKKNVCLEDLAKRYHAYIDHKHKTGLIGLSLFKSFLGKYVSVAPSINDLENLFGKDNYFIHGSLSAVSTQNIPFQTYFKAGRFVGLGVINQFRN